ncbi:hypothetical protein ACN20G_35590 (plasmid) [Streptomyces sp. BI20]
MRRRITVGLVALFVGGFLVGAAAQLAKDTRTAGPSRVVAMNKAELVG